MIRLSLLAATLVMLAVAGVIAGLSGCAAPKQAVSAPATPQSIAQDAINETNQWLLATARVIGSNVEQGVMTKAEAQAALDQVRVIARQADQAQAFVRSGDPRAVDLASLAQRAILALHRQVAERARRTP